MLAAPKAHYNSRWFQAMPKFLLISFLLCCTCFPRIQFLNFVHRCQAVLVALSCDLLLWVTWLSLKYWQKQYVSEVSRTLVRRSGILFQLISKIETYLYQFSKNSWKHFCSSANCCARLWGFVLIGVSHLFNNNNNNNNQSTIKIEIK